MTIEHGGKTVYGAVMGILMLETQFPRIHGDIGNALTWPFPVQYRIVKGASPDKVVRKDPMLLVDDFIDAAQELVKAGCDGITTNCGFLSLYQQALSDAVSIPVATSSLMQVAQVNATLPRGKRAGILTISGSTLSPDHLAAANVPADTPIGSTEGGTEFTRAILGNEMQLDIAAARADNVAAARTLASENPDLGAIVLECTNMVPYAADIRRATGRPVYSIYTLVSWLQAGALPRRFDRMIDDPRT